MKSVLIITPRFPIPTNGACEQDRLAGIMQFKRLGFNVHVVAKIFDYCDKEIIYKFGKDNNIKIDLVRYKFQDKKSFFYYIKRLLNPKFWDSSAYEYFDKEIQDKVESVVTEKCPDLVWFDYTYLWPLYNIVKKFGIKIITRSINFEPNHFLEEDEKSLINYIKFIPKVLSEYVTAKKSDIIFSITLKEQKLYKKLFKNTNVKNLPLRNLHTKLSDSHCIGDKSKLNAFFMGSTYNVSHNRRALEFVIKEIAPRVESEMPGKYIFHIFGGKIPQDIVQHAGENIKIHGFVDNLDEELDKMDIAVIPSLYGAGMQQKIFEPLCKGIPSIISSRGIADYPFESNVHLLEASSVEDFVSALRQMIDIELRKRLSQNSIKLSKELFSRDVLDGIIQNSTIILEGGVFTG